MPLCCQPLNKFSALVSLVNLDINTFQPVVGDLYLQPGITIYMSNHILHSEIKCL